MYSCPFLSINEIISKFLNFRKGPTFRKHPLGLTRTHMHASGQASARIDNPSNMLLVTINLRDLKGIRKNFIALHNKIAILLALTRQTKVKKFLALVTCHDVCPSMLLLDNSRVMELCKDIFASLHQKQKYRKSYSTSPVNKYKNKNKGL